MMNARIMYLTLQWFRSPRRLSRYTIFACLCLTAVLSGCAGLLGVTKLDPRSAEILAMIPKPGISVEGVWAVAQQDGVTVKARWVSFPEPVPTRYNFFGRISYFVTPYTHHTSTVRLRVENASEQYLTVATDQMELDIPRQHDPFRPLPLEYFKRHWPVYAVRNDGMVRDQAIAISHVVRTLFTSRTLRPGENYEGIVPFPRVPADVQEVHLLVKGLRLDRGRFDLSFDFQRVTQ